MHLPKSSVWWMLEVSCFVSALFVCINFCINFYFNIFLSVQFARPNQYRLNFYANTRSHFHTYFPNAYTQTSFLFNLDIVATALGMTFFNERPNICSENLLLPVSPVLLSTLLIICRQAAFKLVS